MEDNKDYFLNCYEINPIFLKGQLRVVNPFERIFKDFLDFLFHKEIYNGENFNKLVKNYYIYKNQFKKYGLTFNVKDGNEYLLSKIFFFPKKYILKKEEFKNKFSFKGEDYFLIEYYLIDRYKEKDNKASFEINVCFTNIKKINIQLITLDEQYQENIKPKNDDLLYIDAIKLNKSFKSLSKELTERELINYKRIKEIPLIFDFIKFSKVDRHPDLDLNDYDSFCKHWEKTIKNAPLYSIDKYDFSIMLNIMYEDQYLSYFKKEEDYSESDHYEIGDEKYLKNLVIKEILMLKMLNI